VHVKASLAKKQKLKGGTYQRRHPAPKSGTGPSSKGKKQPQSMKIGFPSEGVPELDLKNTSTRDRDAGDSSADNRLEEYFFLKERDMA